MNYEKATNYFLDYCMTKQLRKKTMLSYEQAIRLFGTWLERNHDITRIEEIKELHVQAYVAEIQRRGKYTFCANEANMKTNCPQNRRDYQQPISVVTINGYLRNLRVFFNWLVDSECMVKSPMKRVRLIPDERIPKNYLEDNEVREIIRKMDRTYFPEYRDMIAIMVMVDCGTRLGETLSIEVKDLNIIDRTIL